MCPMTLALFFGLLIVVESAVVEKRNNDDACNQILQCVSPIRNSGLFDDPYNTIVNQEAIDNLCAQQETIDQCLSQELLSRCSDQETIAMQSLDTRVLTYICSSRGIQVVSNLVQSGSECLGDQLKLSELDMEINYCNRIFTRSGMQLLIVQNSNICPLLSQLKSCLTGRAETLCGHDFRQLIDDAFEVTSGFAFADYHCNQTERMPVT